MKRTAFIHILTGIKLVSNNVSVVENFNNKALVRIRLPKITGSTKQARSFAKVLARCSYYSIEPEEDGLVVNLEFEWS